MGTRKDFFEIYIQFGHLPSKSFASPCLDVTFRPTRFKIQKFHVLVTLHVCVLHGSENKQQLFPHTTLADWFCVTEA